MKWFCRQEERDEHVEVTQVKGGRFGDDIHIECKYDNFQSRSIVWKFNQKIVSYIDGIIVKNYESYVSGSWIFLDWFARRTLYLTSCIATH